MINILLGFVDSGWYYSLSPCPPLGTDAHTDTQSITDRFTTCGVFGVCVFFFHLAQMNISTRYWRQIIIQRTHSDGLSLLVCGNCYRLCWHSKCSRLVFAWIQKKIEICMSHKVTVVGGYNQPNFQHFKLTNDEKRREKNEKQHGEKRTKHEMGVCTIVLSC